MTEYVECQTFETDGDHNSSQSYSDVDQDDPNTQFSREETYGAGNQVDNPCGS